MDPILKLQTFNPFEKFLTKIPILLFVKFESYNWVMTTGKRGILSLYFINGSIRGKKSQRKKFKTQFFHLLSMDFDETF